MSAPLIHSVDFLIIGAPKSATTWLNRRLALHPQIYMPMDEIHFFSREWERGPAWYAKHFNAAGEQAVTGENSNSYLTEASALPRIAEYLPQSKFIAMLRNPVDRAYSSYGMQVDRGRANTDIDLYLDPKRSPRPHVLTNGLYHDLLEPWFSRFDREQIRVVLFEEMRSNPAAFYRNILEFLGVDPDFTPDSLLSKENVRKNYGVPGGLKKSLWWLRPYLDKGFLRTLRHGPIGKGLEKALSRPKTYPPLCQEIAARLADYYSDDIMALEQLTGEDLSVWRDLNHDRCAQDKLK